MITSKQRDEVVSIHIGEASVSIPLPKNSFVNCHRVVTISALLIQKKITQASPDFVEKVANNIHHLIEDFKFDQVVRVD